MKQKITKTKYIHIKLPLTEELLKHLNELCESGTRAEFIRNCIEHGISILLAKGKVSLNKLKGSK